MTKATSMEKVLLVEPDPRWRKGITSTLEPSSILVSSQGNRIAATKRHGPSKRLTFNDEAIELSPFSTPEQALLGLQRNNCGL